MKIQIASDLHFEFGDKEYKLNIIKQLKKANPDVLVLAGDITSRKEIYNTLHQFSDNFNSVVYVTGNHEHYGTHIDKIREIRNDVLDSFSNVHWLDNSKCEIQEQRFVGCTLWFPYDRLNQLYEKNLNDFYSILNFREWVYKENLASVDYLDDTVTENDIVVTHHLPTNCSIHKNYQNDNLNRFFVCNMNDMIKNNKPKIIVHGHSHFQFDYIFHKTRIVANPLGYPEENKSGEIFDFAKIIEI
jgi:Icc-related predicted phosphoesterase